MKIGELARAAGVSRDTVRHYVARDLLSARRDPRNGYQLFDLEALSRLRFIRTARQLGFCLDDIGRIFSDAERDLSPCPRVRELMEQRILETRTRIAELESLCERMEASVAAWSNMPDSVPDGRSVCRLIESHMKCPQEQQPA